MKKATILSISTALGVMACTFTGCGADPTQAYTEEIEKLSTFGNSPTGTVSLAMNIDSPDTDEQLTIQTLGELMTSMFTTTTEETEAPAYDVAFGLDLAWTEDTQSVGIELGNQTLVNVYMDNDNTYLDLSSLGTAVDGTEMFGDLFSVIEIPNSEISDMGSEITEDGSDLSDTPEKFKATFTDPKVIDAIKGLSDKATLDGTSIEISDITYDDVSTIIDAMKDSASRNGLDSLLEYFNDNFDTEGSTEDAEDSVINYRIDYEESALNQVHTFQTQADGCEVEVKLGLRDTADIDITGIKESAKTLEELTGESDFETALFSLVGMNTDFNGDTDWETEDTDEYIDLETSDTGETADDFFGNLDESAYGEWQSIESYPDAEEETEEMEDAGTDDISEIVEGVGDISDKIKDTTEETSKIAEDLDKMSKERAETAEETEDTGKEPEIQENISLDDLEF